MMTNNRRIVQLIISLILFLGFIAGVYWAYGMSRISIVLPEGNKTITISNVAYRKVFETSDLSFSQLLPSGSYQVNVQSINDETGYTKVVKTGNFFSETTVTPELFDQKPRSFIADNPLECKELLKEVLVSYPCSGQLENMTLHVPATKDTPTYSKTIKDYLNSKIEEFVEPSIETIEAVVNKIDHLQVLTYSRRAGENIHNLYKVSIEGNQIKPTYERSISSIPDHTQFTGIVKDDKLYLYDRFFRNVYTGDDFESLEKINDEDLIVPDKDFFLNNRQASNNNYLSIFEKAPSSSTDTVDDLISKVIITSDGKDKSRTINTQIVRSDFCGDYVCTLSSTGEFYLLDKNLNTLLSNVGVVDYTLGKDSVVIASENNIWQINLGNLSGPLLFSSSEIKITDLSTTQGKIIATVETSYKNYALELDSSGPLPFIDKNLMDILSGDNNDIENISIYRNFIYIVPDLGSKVLNTTSGRLEYSESAKNSARKSISSSLEQSGINNTDYQIYIPLL